LIGVIGFLKGAVSFHNSPERWHLIGGEHSIIEGAKEAETLSVPRHNKFPERVFALLDALTRFRPVASTLCNEAYIMVFSFVISLAELFQFPLSSPYTVVLAWGLLVLPAVKIYLVHFRSRSLISRSNVENL
jgi:hypothetical protein